MIVTTTTKTQMSSPTTRLMRPINITNGEQDSQSLEELRHYPSLSLFPQVSKPVPFSS
jgi:hypothetical protein